MPALVTIVITTHNRSGDLVQAVDSALAQTYTPVEIIVVDDASTDDTRIVCENLRVKHPSILYMQIKEWESRGGNHARNVGILAAHGEYVAFLDDDDRWHPEKTDLQMRGFEETPELACMCCGINEITIVKGKGYQRAWKGAYEQFAHRVYEQHGRKFLYAPLCVTSALLIKKTALVDIGMFDEQMEAYQEAEMLTRLRRKYECGFVNSPLLEYYVFPRKGGGQISDSIEKLNRSLAYFEHKNQQELASFSREERQQWEFQKNSMRFFRCALADRRMEAVRYLVLLFRYRRWSKKILGYLLICIVGYGNFAKLRHYIKNASLAHKE